MTTAPAFAQLATDLRAIFGPRLQALVAYRGGSGGGVRAHALAIVDHLSATDLRACAGQVTTWHEAGLETPLLLEAHEFQRSLDVFPFEFGAIIADHDLVVGHDPFRGLQVDTADLRRACEVQARSHLLHLREGCIETAGRSDALAELVQESAAALAGLLANVSRLRGDFVPGPALTRVANLTSAASVSSDEARQLLPDYLTGLEQLVQTIDRWSEK